jgi:hypothetical protein
MSNNKQQTPVEWQHLELSKFPYSKSEFTDAIDILIKAKEMEKERMIGLLKWMNKIASENPMRLETDDNDIVQQYYNETYGGNK